MRSKTWVSGRSLAGIAGSNPAGIIVVSCERCVLSGRDVCNVVITRSEGSYRMWCVVVCDLKPAACGRHGPRSAAAPQR